MIRGGCAFVENTGFHVQCHRKCAGRGEIVFATLLSMFTFDLMLILEVYAFLVFVSCLFISFLH